MASVGTGWGLAGLALAWLAGIALQLNQHSVWPVEASVSAIVLGIAVAAMALHWRRAFALALPGVAAVAFGSAGWSAAERLAQALPPALEGVDLEVTGVVAGLPQRGPTGVRFRFEVEEARRRDEPVVVPPAIAVGWFSGFDGDAALTPAQRQLGAGERWRFTLRLRQPHGNLNPHGFDYELLLFEQGIRATATVRDAPARRLERAAGHPLERARQRVRDAIEAAVGDARAAGVLVALAVGDQSAIERQDWDLFRDTGIAHLVSISGLHITMFAWLAGLAIDALWRRSVRASLAVPAPLAARWGGVVAAAGYALFSGWGVPSQRTVWMLATVTLLLSAGKRWPWPLVLLAAAVVVTALDPWALLQAGFWLSFAAVGLLMASSVAQAAPASASMAAPGRGRALVAHLRGELRSQVVATIGLTPLTLVVFQQVSLVGFMANLVAIPLVTLLITPLALLGVAAPPLWSLGAWLVQRLCAGLAWLAGWPAAVWTVAVAPVWAQAAGLAAAALLMLPLPWRVRALAVALVLPLLVPVLHRPAPGRFELLAADVGQGTAVLVRTQRHLLVYDAGPQYSRDSDAGQRVLLPLLHAEGATRVDRLILSHRDLDHVGGARSLLQGLEVSETWSSLEAGHPLLALARAPARCAAGQTWQWDGVRFEVLQPPMESYERPLKSNAMSCVLKVESEAGDRALLTGDIEREQEAWLLAERPDRLESDVLVVPHHGSKTSSTPRFIDAVHPRVAVFQAGYRNRFGHPAPDVLARYRARGITLVASPSCGAWRWRGVDEGQGVCQRDVARRYWHHALQGP